jgi:tetratricopeptide (TPR) repeat protein
MFRKRTTDDREKLHEKARRLAAKGEVGRAISALKGWLVSDITDDRTLLKLADLYRRSGDDASAVEAFSRAADLYSARGFALKTAASLRQAAALAPDDLSLLERLGEVNAELGMAREAAILLEQVAAAVAPTGDRARLIALRRRILLLLPSDVGAVIRLADLLVEGGEREEPIRLLEQAAESQRDPGQLEVWFLIQERLVALQPHDVRRTRDLARALLSCASPKRALPRLKACLAAEPGDVESLSLLAGAFESLGLASKSAAAWREVAHAHQRAGRASELAAAWEKVRALLPDDAEAAHALAPPELPARDPSASLADELAEADFLAEHGAVVDARAMLLRLRELFPGSEAVTDRLAELDVETIEPSDLIDLEEEELVLFEERSRDSTTAILDRVPPDVRLRVAESTTHRDLAVAFLEMERYDEALAELEQAIAFDPVTEAACLALAGRCHLARGAPRDAVDAYRRALATTMLTYEAATAVHYELGEALAATGERTDAIGHLGEAARLEPGYREVGAKIAELAALATIVELTPEPA